MLPGCSKFIDKMKEIQDLNERVKETLPSLLKSRSFTSSRHCIYLCEEFEAPCTYWARGEICLVTHMSGRFDFFLRETWSKEEYREEGIERAIKRELPKSFVFISLSKAFFVLPKYVLALINNIMCTRRIFSTSIHEYRDTLEPTSPPNTDKYVVS